MPKDASIGYSSIAASMANGPSLISREVYFMPEIDIKRGSNNLLVHRSTKEQNEEEIATKSKTYETDLKNNPLAFLKSRSNKHQKSDSKSKKTFSMKLDDFKRLQSLKSLSPQDIL